jgi:hypothetical protein
MPMTWIRPLGILLVLAVPAAAMSAGGDDPCAPGRSAFGPTIVVPIEFAQGVTLGRGSPAPYANSLRLYPTYVLDRRQQLRVGLLGGSALANPRLEVLLGGRLSKSLYELNAGPIRGVGVSAALEGVYGTSDRGLLGAMLIGDAGGAFQATLRVEQDLTHGATLLELGLGFQVYDRSPPEKAPVLPAPPRDYLGRVAQQMAITFREAIAIARDESVTACRELVSAARGFVRRADPVVTTVAAFREALDAGGLARVEDLMDEDQPPPPPAGMPERRVVQALYQGVNDVLRTEFGR